MAPTITVKNCLHPSSRVSRYDAGLNDSVLFRDEKGALAEGVIRAITKDGVSVSLLSTSTGKKLIATASIIALMLGE